jgi:hypothetical protein
MRTTLLYVVLVVYGLSVSAADAQPTTETQLVTDVADQGDAHAQYLLGRLYRVGRACRRICSAATAGWNVRLHRVM